MAFLIRHQWWVGFALFLVPVILVSWAWPFIQRHEWLLLLLAIPLFLYSLFGLHLAQGLVSRFIWSLKGTK